jgi:hypothetical protein
MKSEVGQYLSCLQIPRIRATIYSACIVELLVTVRVVKILSAHKYFCEEFILSGAIKLI